MLGHIPSISKQHFYALNRSTFKKEQLYPKNQQHINQLTKWKPKRDSLTRRACALEHDFFNARPKGSPKDLQNKTPTFPRPFPQKSNSKKAHVKQQVFDSQMLSFCEPKMSRLFCLELVYCGVYRGPLDTQKVILVCIYIYRWMFRALAEVLIFSKLAKLNIFNLVQFKIWILFKP